MNTLEVYDALDAAATNLKKELINPALTTTDQAVVFAMLQGVMEARYREYIRQPLAIERRDQTREEPQ